VSEFLRLGPHGAIGPVKGCHNEAGPSGKVRNLYRTDEQSQYTASMLDRQQLNWLQVEVTFEGQRALMLVTEDFSPPNVRATMLTEQADTIAPSGISHFDIQAGGDAYIVLSQMWKPYTDIRTKKYLSRTQFEQAVRPLFQGWWRAVQISDGWRLFADDMNELFFAKLAIPV
jgi:hypothetical protein